MKSLLQALAWYADTVLTTCWPEPERLPNLDQAAALAEREAQEEVAEPASDCCFSEADWLGNNSDPLDRLVALVEDIRNLLSSAVFAAGVAESPGEVEPPASPGQASVLFEASKAVYAWIGGQPCRSDDVPYFRDIARDLYDAALKQRSK